MLARLAADAVLVLHMGFIVFVLLGALLAVHWRWAPIVHLPSAAWGVFVEVTGRVCPLTCLENDLRFRAGQAGYAESFVGHYILPVIYPAGLTRNVQFTLTFVVLASNLAIYAWVFVRRRQASPRDA